MDMSLADPRIPRDSNLNKQKMLLPSWHGCVNDPSTHPQNLFNIFL